MRKAGVAALVAGGCVAGLVVFCGLVVFSLFIVKYLWGWVIPDVFPGAVKQGLIAKSLSWYTAFKVAVFVAAMGGIMRFSMHRDER